MQEVTGCDWLRSAPYRLKHFSASRCRSPHIAYEYPKCIRRYQDVHALREQ